MKRLLISAFAVCVAAAVPTALWAENQDKGHSHGSGGGTVEHHATGGTTGGHGMGGMSGGVHHTRTVHHYTGSASGGTTRHYRTSHNRGTTSGGRITTGGRMGGRGTTHTNVDVSSYRKNVTAEHHYHFGDYRAPEGYSYHRWSYGDNLPAIYFAQDYWITNYLNFGLIAPPDGYVWVRYGPDALLIDEDTGEIVQVVYGLFY